MDFLVTNISIIYNKFSIVVKVHKTTHYILKANCFLFQVNPLIVKHMWLK